MINPPSRTWMRLQNRGRAPGYSRSIRCDLIPDLTALRNLNSYAVDYEPAKANVEQLDQLIQLAEKLAAGLDEIAERS